MKKIRILTFCFVMIHIIAVPWVTAGEWWAVYFTMPEKKYGFSQKEDPETGLLNTIEHCTEYFYGAFFELSEQKIIDALIRAKLRGIDVRLVMEHDNTEKTEVQKLFDAGIDIVTDKKHGFMHNKFAVIDGICIWTGSYNCTKNGNWKNNNNAVKICSKDLADIYLNEFFEMHHDRVFGNRINMHPFALFSPQHLVQVDETTFKVYFSPDDGVENKILSEMKNANKSIHVMAFSLTSKTIADMLIYKFNNGVNVRGIVENRGARGRHSKYTYLVQNGVPIKIDNPRITMHNKVIIIDEKVVITGSYNFSKNAEYRNDENIIVINNSAIADEFMNEFHRLYH